MYIYLFFASHQSNVRGFMPMPYNSLIKFYEKLIGKIFPPPRQLKKVGIQCCTSLAEPDVVMSGNWNKMGWNVFKAPQNHSVCAVHGLNIQTANLLCLQINLVSYGVYWIWCKKKKPYAQQTREWHKNRSWKKMVRGEGEECQGERTRTSGLD